MARLTGIVTLLVSLAVLHLASSQDRAALAPFLNIRYKMNHCENMMEGLGAMLGKSHSLHPTDQFAHLNKDRTSVFTLTEADGQYTLTKEVDITIRGVTHRVVIQELKFRIGQRFRELELNGQPVYATIYQEGATLTKFRTGRIINTVTYSFTSAKLKVTTMMGGVTVTCKFYPEQKGENDF